MARAHRAPRPLAVSIGCPAGVGPEVALAAAKRLSAPLLLVGDLEVLREAASRVKVAARRLTPVSDAAEVASLPHRAIAVWGPSAAVGERVAPGKPTSAAGAAQLRWIDQAVELVAGGSCGALVTGPVSKEAIAGSGARGAAGFRGHTEHIAARTGASEVVMAFALGGFATSLVTTHLPLARVPRAVSEEKVAGASFWLCHLLARLGVSRPRVAVCGLNPHAGEHGLLGREELDVIEPGIAAARARLAKAKLKADLLGPLGAETAYRLGGSAQLDGVVAMYHDQATIACKLMGFGEAVNVTLGLPIVRTSVDHGTAYDLAGSGHASPAGMLSAIELAARLCSNPAPSTSVKR